jgi:hypothetical protein
LLYPIPARPLPPSSEPMEATVEHPLLPPKPPVPKSSAGRTEPTLQIRGRKLEHRLLRDAAIAGLVLAALAVLVAISVRAIRSSASAADGRPSLVVTAAGPGGITLAEVHVFVDGVLKCQTTPCSLAPEAGARFVQVQAPGFVRPAMRAVVVDDARPATLHFDLERDAALSPPAPAVEVPAAVATAAPLPVRPAAAAPIAAPGPRPAPRAVSAPPAAPSHATLELGSTPPARVVLDGKPLGMTPQSVRVSPGAHSVLFVHPELGRKQRSANVEAGARRSIAVAFAR